MSSFAPGGNTNSTKCHSDPLIQAQDEITRKIGEQIWWQTQEFSVENKAGQMYRQRYDGKIIFTGTI